MSDRDQRQPRLTYRDAGVDIDAGNRSVELIRESVRATYRPEVIGDLGGFGGLFALGARYRDPVLVSGTDGVGTKLKVAFRLGRHGTIGQDAVAMCVNDIIVSGAEPLFFLDYLAVGRLVPEQVAEIVAGVAAACRESGCALIGGETAEMAGFYPDGEYDLAGFAVGVVERADMVLPDRVREGDLVLGLPSTGLHSNGFSLARRIVFDVRGLAGDEAMPELGGRAIGDALLAPTRLYPPVVMPLLRGFRLHGLAHITGGGFYDNLPRALPDGLGIAIDSRAWEVPPIFALLQRWGGVDTHEMYRTFNMGMGMALIVGSAEAAAVRASLAARGEPSAVIGEVVRGDRAVAIRGVDTDG